MYKGAQRGKKKYKNLYNSNPLSSRAELERHQLPYYSRDKNFGKCMTIDICIYFYFSRPAPSSTGNQIDGGNNGRIGSNSLREIDRLCIAFDRVGFRIKGDCPRRLRRVSSLHGDRDQLLFFFLFLFFGYVSSK